MEGWGQLAERRCGVFAHMQAYAAVRNAIVQAEPRKADHERRAWAVYRRLVGLFGNVVREPADEKLGETIKRVKEDRGVNADAELGLCDEPDGGPASIDFCHPSGIKYVSCDTYRVAVAGVAAAQVAIRAT